MNVYRGSIPSPSQQRWTLPFLKHLPQYSWWSPFWRFIIVGFQSRWTLFKGTWNLFNCFNFFLKHPPIPVFANTSAHTSPSSQGRSSGFFSTAPSPNSKHSLPKLMRWPSGQISYQQLRLQFESNIMSQCLVHLTILFGCL